MKQYRFIYNNFQEMQAFINSSNIKESSNVLIQVFTGIIEIEFIEKVISEILSILPQAEIIGATTAGEIFEENVLTNSTIISFTIFEETKIKSKLLNSNDNEYELGINIVKELIEEYTKVIILFCDGLLTHGKKIIEAIQSLNNNVIICGGKAGDNGAFKETFVFTKDGITKNGMAAVSLTGKQLNIITEHSFGWSTIGKSMNVTKAANDKVYTIDNIKTVDIYKKYLGEKIAKGLPMYAIEFPLIVIKDDIEMAKVPYECNKDGSISFLSSIETNDKVKFGYGNVNMLIDQSIAIADKLKEKDIEVLFVYSCSSRRSFMQDKISLEIAPLNNIVPAFGFFTYGEFLTINKSNKLLNVTMTILGISEGEKRLSNNKPLLIKEESPSKVPFAGKEVESIKAFTNLINQATNELQQANKVLEEQKHKIEQMNNITKSILQINSEMISSGGFENFLQIILDKVLAIIPNGKVGSILLLQHGKLHYKAVKGYTSDRVKDVTYEFEDTYYYKEKCTEELFNPIILRDLEKTLFSKAQEYNLWKDMVGEVPSELLTCLIGINGQVEGVINIFSTSKERCFDEEDKRTLKYLCYDIAMAIKNYKLLKDILNMSRYDSLTGLYNRHYFREKLNKTIDKADISGKVFVVCMMDLNNLKLINDNYGHDAGDEILIKFADVVKKEINSDGIVGRLGGDEFAGIFIDKNTDKAMKAIDNVCIILKNNALYFRGNKEEISFAYGLSEFPKDSEDIDELLKIADKRMYDKKKMMKKHEQI